MKDSMSSSREGRKSEALDFQFATVQDPKLESVDSSRFRRSLQELRDLRSQLHYAADYCEISFSKAKQKKLVLENTKEYICNAVITVVDHLGSVSANLDCLIDGRDEISQTELRMDGLQQRLFMFKEYARELELAQLRRIASSSAYYPRYTSASTSTLIEPVGRLIGSMSRDGADIISAKSTTQYKCNLDVIGPCIIKKINTHSNPGFGFSSMLPDGPSILSKPRTSSFGSQTKDSPRFRYTNLTVNDKNKKSVHGSKFLPFLRRSKRVGQST